MHSVGSDFFGQHYVVINEEGHAVSTAECQDLPGLLLQSLSFKCLFSELDHGDASPKGSPHLLRQRLPAQPAGVRDCIQKTILQLQAHFKLQFLFSEKSRLPAETAFLIDGLGRVVTPAPSARGDDR